MLFLITEFDTGGDIRNWLGDYPSSYDAHSHFVHIFTDDQASFTLTALT